MASTSSLSRDRRGVKTKDQDVRLGDIVFGTKIIPYRKGKALENGIKYTGDPIKPPRELVPSFTSLEEKVRDGLNLEREIELVAARVKDSTGENFYERPKQDRLYSSEYLHGSACDCEHSGPSSPHLVKRRARVPYKRVAMHQGIIASAEQVMKNATERDKVSRESDCTCFEMEAAGVTNIHHSLSIRGISDYSDGHKNDSWLEYPSLAAAVGARELLRTLTPAELDRCPFYLLPEEVANLIHGASQLVESSAGMQFDDPETLRGVLNKLTNRQELMEHLIKPGLKDLQSPDLSVSNDEKTAELGIQMTQLIQSQSQLKDCFEKLQGVVKECSLSKEDYITRQEWEKLQQQVDDQTIKVAAFEKSTDHIVDAMRDLFSVIEDQTGNKNFGFIAKYLEFVKQFGKSARGLSTPVSALADGIKQKPSTDDNHDDTDSDTATNKPRNSSFKSRFSRAFSGRKAPDDDASEKAVGSSLAGSRSSSIPRSSTSSSVAIGAQPVMHKSLSAQTTANDSHHTSTFKDESGPMSISERVK